MAEPVIPSIAEIRASKEVLSPPDTSTTVVKVNNLAVKFGGQVCHQEVANLEYIWTNSNVRVPKVFASFTDPESGDYFIVMEYLEGQTLEDIRLTASERLEVKQQLQAALTELRNLPSPGYIGSVGDKPCEDGVFWQNPFDPAISGPFTTEEEMNEAMVRKLSASETGPYLALIRTLVSSTLRGHRTMFTHGDFQPKNIMVRRTGSAEDGGQRLEVMIIDWATAGWYPEYWEFCKSTIIGRFRPEWLELVRDIMPTYTTGYLMMQVILGHLFW